MSYNQNYNIRNNNVLEVWNTEIGQPAFEYLYFGSYYFGVTIQGLCNVHAKIYLSNVVISFTHSKKI